MHPIRASVVIYFKVETQWRLGLKVKLDSSLPSLITNPIIYILHMLLGHYLFKLFSTSIIFYPHNLRLCVCVHIYIIWREREREREREIKLSQLNIWMQLTYMCVHVRMCSTYTQMEREITLEEKNKLSQLNILNAVNINVCAHSYAQHIHTNG